MRAPRNALPELSPSMRDTLRHVTAEWSRIPPAYSCANQTVVALDRRGFIEIKLEPNRINGDWYWRLKPKAVAA